MLLRGKAGLQEAEEGKVSWRWLGGAQRGSADLSQSRGVCRVWILTSAGKTIKGSHDRTAAGVHQTGAIHCLFRTPGEIPSTLLGCVGQQLRVQSDVSRAECCQPCRAVHFHKLLTQEMLKHD